MTQPIALPACIVNCAEYDASGHVRDITLDEISDVIAQENNAYVWVGSYEPDIETLRKLQEEFSLHDLAIEDALTSHQRPKLEIYEDSIFFAIKCAQLTNGEIEYGHTYVFLGKRFLITIRRGSTQSFRAAVADTLRDKKLSQLGPSAVLYAVLDQIVDHFVPITEKFSNELDRLERDIFADEYSTETVEKLYELKRQLTRMRMTVTPLQEIVSQLMRGQNEFINKRSLVYFRDIYDHVIRLNDSIDTLREMLTAAMNVNLSLVTLHQGEVVKRLAGWAALLAAPTLITSWYGMNFKNMPELAGKYSYPILIGIVILVCLGLYRYLKKIKWL